jgi:predicted lipoprotein with Yx(FWY)xxD motif
MTRIRSTMATTVVLLVATAACGQTEDDASAAPGTEAQDEQERETDAEPDVDDATAEQDTSEPSNDDVGDSDSDSTGSGDDDGNGNGDGTGNGDVVVGTATSELGTILVDGDGLTLYLFDNDTDGESVCYDDCAVTWPPLLGDATVGEEADASLLGTTTREDGTEQVTYAGMPLYHYAGDGQPGDVAGQGLGGVWWVIAPDGERITDDVAAASAGRRY